LTDVTRKGLASTAARARKAASDPQLRLAAMTLLRLREELGLTQEDVAKMFGTTPRSIGAAERGEVDSVMGRVLAGLLELKKRRGAA
jgi:DNA-binding XRE family transcriptional regulator